MRLLQESMGLKSVQVYGNRSAASFKHARQGLGVMSERVAARNQQIDWTSGCVIQSRQRIGPATAAGIGHYPVSFQAFSVQAVNSPS